MKRFAMTRYATLAAVGGLMMTTALAQQSPTPPGQSAPTPPQKQEQTKPPSTPGTNGAAQFINEQSSTQLLGSKFVGTDVVGPDNKKVGDIQDMVMEKDGRIVAYVVRIGGFLGIGSKDVGLAPSAFKPVPSSTGSATTGSSGSSDPNDIKLQISMTQEQLKAAPDFNYFKAPPRTTSNTPGAPGAPGRPSPTTR